MTFTCTIAVEDYPDIDADTADGKEEFGALAVEMSRRDPILTHFVFTRAGEMIGEIYVTKLLETRQ